MKLVPVDSFDGKANADKVLVDENGDAYEPNGKGGWKRRKNPAEGLLVRGWQHNYEIHVRGCPSTTYYAASCSDACIRGCELVGFVTPKEREALEISGSEYGKQGGSVTNYG